MWQDKQSLQINVKPNTSPTKIIKYEGDILYVQLKAEPEDGKANKELLKLLKKESK